MLNVNEILLVYGQLKDISVQIMLHEKGCDLLILCPESLYCNRAGTIFSVARYTYESPHPSTKNGNVQIAYKKIL